jgi:hypothetical protein
MATRSRFSPGLWSTHPEAAPLGPRVRPPVFVGCAGGCGRIGGVVSMVASDDAAGLES